MRGNLKVSGVLIFMIAVGCKSPSTVGSEVKFGFKTGNVGDGVASSFYHVLPWGIIAFNNGGVSPETIRLLKDAANYWLKPLG